MARHYDTALAELEALRAERDGLVALTDSQLCHAYNVDSRAEILRILAEEIGSLEREADYLVPPVYEPDPYY